MGSVLHLSSCIHTDLLDLCPDLYKSPREKLSLMVGALIEAQSCNLMDLAALLPLETERAGSRYAWIERFLSADTVDERGVQKALTRQLLHHLHGRGETIVLCVDQTSLGNVHGIAMVSVRVGGRGLPLFWTTQRTAGNIATRDYLELLDAVAPCMPDGADVLVMADRFFDAAQIIERCKTHGWGWRLRLRHNRILTQDGGEITASELARLHPLCPYPVHIGDQQSFIGSVHDRGHEEPWIIAMDAPPTRARVLDYGLRWSIEAMFSDSKTRGFNLQKSHILRSDRLSKLILVVSVAMHWCVFTGLSIQKNTKTQAA
jgi:hypothetical protein